MDKLEFCRRFAFLKGEPIAFSGRPYLPAIYAARRGNLILRASRQVEKSTFLANTIAFECLRNPGIEILFVAPRAEQSQLFSNARLRPLLEQSPLLRRGLLSRKAHLRVTSMTFSNGSRIHLRAAYRSADACRGLSADMLFVDELQDIAAGMCP